QKSESMRWIAGSSPAMTNECASLALDAGLADDRPPLVDLGLVEGRECLRRLLRARKHVLAEIGEALAHGGVGQRLDDDAVEPCYDLLWRALGRPDGFPEGQVESGQAGFVDGRDLGRGRPAWVGPPRRRPAARCP